MNDLMKTMALAGLDVIDHRAWHPRGINTTLVNEIYAKKLLMIKRQLLKALAEPEKFLPQEKRSEILRKFGDFAISAEEADWHGLPIELAREKQEALERLEDEKIENTPLKAEFRAELVSMLKEGAYQDLDADLLSEDTETVGGFFNKAKNYFKKT